MLNFFKHLYQKPTTKNHQSFTFENLEHFWSSEWRNNFRASANTNARNCGLTSFFYFLTRSDHQICSSFRERMCESALVSLARANYLTLVTFAWPKVTSAASLISRIERRPNARCAARRRNTCVCITFTQLAAKAMAPELRSQLQSETEIKSFAAAALIQ